MARNHLSLETNEKPTNSSKIEKLILNTQKLSSLSGVETFTNLKILSLSGNIIQEISNLDRCLLLEELCLEDNMISKIENLQRLRFLKKLDLGRNFISKIENLKALENLTQLSLEDNLIESLDGIQQLYGILELYIGNNRISNMKDVLYLKELRKLIILDISGNLISKEANSRIYMIFNLKKLKVLNGAGVESSEQSFAKEYYGGKLSDDLLESRLNSSKKSEIRILDLSSAKLRSFDDVFSQSSFPSLIELNLCDNHITNLRCFSYMPKLTKLNLAKNKLESLITGDNKGLVALPNLEALDVSYNLLQNLSGLQSAKLTNLRVLIVAHNNLETIDYIENQLNLRELDLSTNNIKQIDSSSFIGQVNLRFLRLDENRIRYLSNLGPLSKLQCLQLNANRIQELLEIEKLQVLPNLMELSLMNNPVVRKNQYRILVIKRLPHLMFLDRQDVTAEEREKIEIAAEIKPPALVHLASQSTNQKVHVKLTSVNLEAVFGRNDKDKKPNSSTLSNFLGVTPLNNLLKPKNLRK